MLQSYTLTVSGSNINYPPVITSQPKTAAAVGDATCLTDPGLAAVAQDYRRQAQARLQPIDPDSITKRLPRAPCHVSQKIDGEFNILVYADGETILVNPGGTVRTGLSELESAALHLEAAGIRSAIIPGELWYDRAGQRERVHDVARVARRPESEKDLLDLEFTAFDIVDLDGRSYDGYEHVLATLAGYNLKTPPTFLATKPDDILWQFDQWVTKNGHEGLVLRSDLAGSFKVKPRHTIDAVVIGFTERQAADGGEQAGIHDLLVALMRADGTFQVLGRVGGGFTDADRRAWLCDLQDDMVSSDYVESNDGLAYRMVRPTWVIEISILDLITQTTRGVPIQSMCLDWDREGPSSGGCWRRVRRLPLAAMISTQFVRRRGDKGVNPQDLRLGQITSLVEVPLADRDARRFELPKSELLRREVYTKQLKGHRMVRKLVMWKTNKELADGVSDFPAYVIHFTDYSPGRATPLEREIRVSNSREQIEELWEELAKEKIVKGWTWADWTVVRRAG